MTRWLVAGVAVVFLSLHCGEEYQEPFYPWPAQPPRDIDTEPDWSPDGSTIAFRHRVDEIWLLDLATGQRSYLARGYWPTWSPDGRKIAFVWDRNIHVIEVLSKRITRLTDWEWCCYPAWSPDGTRIAFDVPQPIDSAGIWIMNADGTDKTDISVHGTGQWRCPNWSPDGLWIAHTRYTAGECQKPFVFVMTPTGSSPEQLTHTCRENRHPRWSPDGQKIAYASISPGASNPATGVWVMNAYGSQQRQLARSPYAVRPVWSPDGARIVYEGLNTESWTITLWIMNADGSDQRPLTLSAG